MILSSTLIGISNIKRMGSKASLVSDLKLASKIKVTENLIWLSF